MNKRDDCLSHEVLVSSYKKSKLSNFDELMNNRTDILIQENAIEPTENEKDDTKTDDRLLINPEFAESMDLSDGSEMFSPEDRKIEEEATSLN